MNKIWTLVIVLATTIFGRVQAQAPSILWQTCAGGTSEEYAMSIQLANGGYIATGYTKSNNGSLSNNHGSFDVWVVKLNTTGGVVWQKCYGGSSQDYGRSIMPTSDGGYIVAAYTWSSDGDVIGQHGSNSDIWVLKLNDTGGVQWKKCYGGTKEEDAGNILTTTDGGYIIGGTTSSNDGDVSGWHGTSGSFEDAWVLKLNDTGGIAWQKCLGGTNSDGARSIAATLDGGYILAGGALSNDGDVSGVHSTDTLDVWVVKLNDLGSLQWQKCFGGSKFECANYIATTPDGGFILTGYTNSNDGDVSGLKGSVGGYPSLNADVWVLKLSSTGSLQWQKCLGGGVLDEGKSVLRTSDGGYLVACNAQSSNLDVTGFHGQVDFWLVKLDNSGNKTWQKCYGGTNADAGNCMVQDGSNYVIAGSTNSGDGDVGSAYPPNVYPDGWIVKLGNNSDVMTVSNKVQGANIFPNPANDVIYINAEDPNTIRILNTLGQTVKTAFNTNQINISDLAPNTYLLFANDASGSLLFAEKFVKD